MQGEHPVQHAGKAANVPHYGYCLPGQIMRAVALLNRSSKPRDPQIVDAMNAGTG